MIKTSSHFIYAFDIGTTELIRNGNRVGFVYVPDDDSEPEQGFLIVQGTGTIECQSVNIDYAPMPKIHPRSESGLGKSLNTLTTNDGGALYNACKQCFTLAEVQLEEFLVSAPTGDPDLSGLGHPGTWKAKNGDVLAVFWHPEDPGVGPVTSRDVVFFKGSGTGRAPGRGSSFQGQHSAGADRMTLEDWLSSDAVEAFCAQSNVDCSEYEVVRLTW